MNKFSRRLTLTLALGGALAASAAAFAVAADKDLIVFDWSGYEDPSFHPKYVEKNGDSPTFAFFGDEDEAFEKVRSGFKADLGHPCSQSVTKWREAGLLQPLDTSKITGWKDLNPGIMAMKDLATTSDGKAWFMPWDWGNTQLTTPGLGSYIANATTAGDFPRVVLGIVVMCAFVTLFNRLFWRQLYAFGERRLRLG